MRMNRWFQSGNKRNGNTVGMMEHDVHTHPARPAENAVPLTDGQFTVLEHGMADLSKKNPALLMMTL